ncbi:MAG: ferritin [Desulfopila sp.]
MLHEKMTKALNQQINMELYSAYLYMSMSNHSAQMGLKGFATWFMVQYHEEMYHGMKIYDYVQRQGEPVRLEAIEAPPATFESPLDMFTKTLAHEQQVTRSFNELMELASGQKDHATKIFLEWFITEQIEEEENDNDIIQQLKLIGDNPHALLMLDRELAARTISIPLDYSQGLAAEA